MRHRGERCDGERRLILSHNGEETFACAGNCEGEWVALHLCWCALLLLVLCE